MSTGGTVTGAPEVLAFESSPPGVGSVSRRWARVALTLVAGSLLGAWTGAEVHALANPPTVLVAGPLHTVRECASTCLSLTLRNDGRVTVEVTPVALGSRALGLGSHPVAVRPGAWTTVPLHAPVACDGPPPGRATSLTLRVEGGSPTSFVRVPLHRGADVPAWRYDRLCLWGAAYGETDLGDGRTTPTGPAVGHGTPCIRVRGDDTLGLCVPLTVERAGRDVPAGVTER